MDKIINLFNLGEYQEVLELLENQNDEFSVLYKSKAYYQLELFEKCHDLLELNKGKFSKLYYDYFLLLIDCLEKLNFDDKMLELIEEELRMPYVPKKVLEVLEKKVAENIAKEKLERQQSSKTNSFTNEEIKDLLTDYQNLSNEVIFELANRNIRYFLKEIKEILINKKIEDDTIKVYLLDQLRIQAINEDIEIYLHNLTMNVNPYTLEPVFDERVINEITTLFSNITNGKESSSMEIYIAILFNYLNSVYPISVEEDEYNLIAAAVHCQLLKVLNREVKITEIANLYNINLELLESYYQKIESINILKNK